MDLKTQSGARKFFMALLAFNGEEYPYPQLDALLRSLARDPDIALYVDPTDVEFDLLRDGEYHGWLKPLPNPSAGQVVARIDVRDAPLFRKLIAEELPHVQAAITYEIDRLTAEAKKTNTRASALLKQLSDPKALAPMEQKLHAEAQKRKVERRKKARKLKKPRLDIKVKASQLSRRALHSD